MTKNIELLKEAKAWLKRKSGPDEIVRVVPDIENNDAVKAYNLYAAYEENPDHMGRILFESERFSELLLSKLIRLLIYPNVIHIHIGRQEVFVYRLPREIAPYSQVDDYKEW